MLKEFFWSGQEISNKPRVDFQTILKLKRDGGLGLISIEAFTIARAGLDILWVTQEGDHPLQCMYRVKLGELSLRRCGTDDYSWMLS